MQTMTEVETKNLAREMWGYLTSIIIACIGVAIISIWKIVPVILGVCIVIGGVGTFVMVAKGHLRRA